jgi:nucleoside-diphosphate-sugar epimerase
MSSFYAGKKVLVTGGGGFLGSHLVENLIRAGAHVVVAQRRAPNAGLDPIRRQARFQRADLMRLEDCLEATRGVALVFHLAAEVAGVQFNTAHPGLMFFRNTTLTQNMLEAAKISGVERFLYTSSSCVYSPSVPTPYREEDGFLGEPDSSNIGYGWAKRMGELGARFYGQEYGMKIGIARLANLYGPRDNFDTERSHVIPALIRRVFQSEDSLEVWGTGTQIRSFLYVKDAAIALISALEKCATGDPLNIGTNEQFTIRQLAELVIELSGKPLALKFDVSKPEGQMFKTTDVSKMKRILDWEPEYTFRQGVQETIAWYISHKTKLTT